MRPATGRRGTSAVSDDDDNETRQQVVVQRGVARMTNAQELMLEKPATGASSAEYFVLIAGIGKSEEPASRSTFCPHFVGAESERSAGSTSRHNQGFARVRCSQHVTIVAISHSCSLTASSSHVLLHYFVQQRAS